MTCPRRDTAEAYLDSELNEQQHLAFERHAEGCTECAAELAELQAYLTEMQRLSEVTAPAQAWEQILARLEDDPESASQDALQALPKQHSGVPANDTPRKSLLQRLQELLLSPQAAMVAACAVCAVFVLTGRMDRERAQPLPATQRAIASQRHQSPIRARAQRPKTQRLAAARRPKAPQTRQTKARGLQAVMTALRGARQQYEAALGQLHTAAMARLKKEPAKARILRKTLLALDQAIAQCKQALRQEPSSLDTQRILLAVYQRKVDLLRDVVLGNI